MIPYEYEEGTFTPKVGGSEQKGTATYTLQTGYYKKIGNIVFYDFQIIASSLTGSSGMLFLYGFPYKESNVGIAIGNLAIVGSNFDRTQYYQTRGFRDGLIIDKDIAMTTMNVQDWDSRQNIYGTGFYFIK